MATVLSVASRAVLDACERLGLDGSALLNAANLTREQLDDPDRRLAARHADALWEAAFAEARDPHLALHAAVALPFGAYRVVDFLAAHSPTMGDAFKRIASYFALVDVRGVFAVGDGPPATVVMRSATAQALPPPAQEYTFAALVTRARTCAGPSWSPDAVELTFPAPANTHEHRRIFACEVRFGRPEARLICSPAAWSAPVGGADPALLSVLEDHAARLLAELPPSDDLASRVKSAIAEALHRGDVTAATIARRLGTSERTLQRRLKDEGLTLAELLDQTRAAVAKTHLENPHTALAEIAWLLGFSDQSTFTRAFRRWTGVTPGAFRDTRTRAGRARARPPRT